MNCDTEAYRCSMESDGFLNLEMESESSYGVIGVSNGVNCSAAGCNKKKHPRSKYCAYHKVHRPRSTEAYEKMASRF